jgi:PadR family transcriptional regulator PadR
MDEKLLSELLSTWEETHKKGQLTFWIFLALQKEKKYVDEIKEFVETQSKGTITCEEQSLYRALRKYEHIQVVAYETGKGHKGPERKYYYLTDLGQALFRRFVERNIRLFYSDELVNLLNF